jgi:hypothetical protein
MPTMLPSMTIEAWKPSFFARLRASFADEVEGFVEALA